MRTRGGGLTFKGEIYLILIHAAADEGHLQGDPFIYY